MACSMIVGSSFSSSFVKRSSTHSSKGLSGHGGRPMPMRNLGMLVPRGN